MKYSQIRATPNGTPRDMFDFLEDAGRKLDQAGRELGEREAFGPAHFATERTPTTCSDRWHALQS